MSGHQLLPHQRARERAVLVVVLLDVVGGFGVLTFGLLADSLTLIADGLRGVLLLATELYTWITLRKIHRGRFAEYDFGTGKIERLVNLAIAIGLLGAVATVAAGAIARLDHEPSSSAAFFATAVFFAELNLLVNVYGLASFARANQGQPSIILESQIGARVVKAVSSFVVFLVLLASGLIPDPTVGALLDVLGSIFVCVLMVRTALQQLRESLPDLLDRSLADATQVEIYRVLADNFGRFDDIVAVRSRRSGQDLMVDVELGFEPRTTMDQISNLQALVAEQVRARLPEARVRILPALARWRAGPDPDPRLSAASTGAWRRSGGTGPVAPGPGRGAS